MKKTIKHYSKKFTQSKWYKLHQVALGYYRVRSNVFNEFSGLKGLKYIKSPRLLEKEWIDLKYGETFGLQARQWKQALYSALGTIKSIWERSFRLVKIDIMRYGFSEEERKYLFGCLFSYNSVYEICSGLKKSFLDKWLHSKIRKHLGNNPKNKSLTFSIDEDMYDHTIDKKNNHWIRIMTLTPYKRVYLPLTGKPEKIKGTIIIVLHKNLIEIQQPIEFIPEPKKKGPEIGMDKGYGTLLHSSSEKKYGQDFGKLLTEESDRLFLKNKNRNKLRSIIKNNPDSIQSKHIDKFNLGKDKYLIQKQVNRNVIQDFINKSIQEFLDKEDPGIIVSENLDFQSWNHLLGKKQKRLFSSWLKGVLRNRLRYKCQQNGVLLAEINPAYTSQTCPFCGFVHKDNRKGDKFHCLNCGREGDADYFASLNILSKYKDPDIGLYTPYKQVYNILMGRFNQSVETVQPGLQKSSGRVYTARVPRTARRANYLIGTGRVLVGFEVKGLTIASVGNGALLRNNLTNYS